MTELTEIEMTCADPRNIEEFENLTKQIESVETYEELMPLLRNRAKIMSHILGAPLRLLEKQRTE